MKKEEIITNDYFINSKINTVSILYIPIYKREIDLNKLFR